MISRETKIVQSVQDYLRAKLYGPLGYTEQNTVMLDSFPYNRFDGKLDKEYVASGFNFDDGGAQAELGSSLRRYVHTIEFFVFGTGRIRAEGLANNVKYTLISEGGIPLKDYEEPDPAAVIATLEVLTARTERVPSRDPRPWEEHVWVTRIQIQDESYDIDED